VQPPSQKALWITLAFFGLTALLWFAVENRRFQGPPVLDALLTNKPDSENSSHKA
jgi:hypothetical protein